ncbi:hypothetical protein WK25_24770 [Burkholderia latens]|nr:hypothetical protein WK25_24770 [Burkholderia latens]
MTSGRPVHARVAARGSARRARTQWLHTAAAAFHRMNDSANVRPARRSRRTVHCDAQPTLSV